MRWLAPGWFWLGRANERPGDSLPLPATPGRQGCVGCWVDVAVAGGKAVEAEAGRGHFRQRFGKAPLDWSAGTPADGIYCSIR